MGPFEILNGTESFTYWVTDVHFEGVWCSILYAIGEKEHKKIGSELLPNCCFPMSRIDKRSS